NGIVNAFYRRAYAPLAPGTLVEIYGSGLSSGSGQPGLLPLPNMFQGTSVLIGGENAPFVFTSDMQLDVELPADLPPNEQYSLIVSNVGKLSVPQMLTLTSVAPGAFTSTHADGSLVDASHPATPGETLVMYLL